MKKSEGILVGRRVAFTGRLASMTRDEAARMVEACGGRFAPSPTRQTDLLVVGQEGWPLRRDGHLTRKLEKARSLKESGASIRIVPETDFLREVGLEQRQEDVHRLYTTVQLGRILSVPRDRIRLWVRSGFIQPVKTVHRLEYFDFHQVAAAKALGELAASGVSMSRIRRSLRQLKSWMPGVDSPLSRLRFIERDGQVVLKLRGGHLAEPNGQLLFDFSAKPAAGLPAADVFQRMPRSADEWFELALSHEDSGRLIEASDAYRQAIDEAGPQPEFCFNLGNVLYALERRTDALESFQQAVELDPEYVECWNNLGNVYSDLECWEESIRSYRRALEIEPYYADAHYNLAETLSQIGRLDDARVHWQAYLRQDPNSSWARSVRERLRASGVK